MRIKVNDTVLVTSGDDKGKRGRVLRVDRAGAQVVVEGVNKVWKHVRRSQKNPQGGRLSKELPIDLSKVQLVCPACNRPTRVGARQTADGGKERFCKKCGATLGQIVPAKARRGAPEA
jgi:large subunit ribosomal protein L24